MEIVTVKEFIKRYLNREIVLFEEYLFETEIGLLYIEEIDLTGDGEIRVRNATADVSEYLTKDDKLCKVTDIEIH